MSGGQGIPRTHALNRAIDVLVAVVEAGQAVSASALARTTGQPRPTVSRTLRTLLDRGLVMETPTGWIAGNELVRLVRLTDPLGPLLEAAKQPLARLRDDTSESAMLAVPTKQTEVQVVAQVDTEHRLGVVGWIGADIPLHASAAGKLLLAELSQSDLIAWISQTRPARLTSRTIVDVAAMQKHLALVRRRGWADIVDELEPGLVSLAAPVRDSSGALTAMVGISGPSSRLTTSRRKADLPYVLRSAAEIEHALIPAHPGSR